MAEKRVKLKSNDGEMFEVDEAVALQSELVKDWFETVTDTTAPDIKLDNVTGETLAKVIEYCKYHVKNQKTSEDKPAISADEIKAWDAKFLKMDQSFLFDLLLAAHYMNIKSLLDLICQTVADMVKDQTLEETRTTFNIENDFNPEEEEKLRAQIAWAFRK